jgi:hypothetical protein
MSGSTEHRKAPRRVVKEIKRIGGWGDVKYHHFLECGHIEVRPRATTAPKLACVWCLRADAKENEMKALAVAKPTTYDDSLNSAIEETEINIIHATIASRFGIPKEAIDIVVKDVGGRLEVTSARIFLSASDVRRIAGPTESGS